MGSQMIQIIILAAIALFLILRLRNVLGTREGFEKPREVPGPARPNRGERPFEVIEGGAVDPDIADFVDPEAPAGQALAAMKRVDPSFSVSEFSHGARAAYEMIVMAYENGDLEALRQYLAPEVYEPFAEAIEAAPRQGLHRRGLLRRHPRGPPDRRALQPGDQRGRRHHALRRRADLGGPRSRRAASSRGRRTRSSSRPTSGPSPGTCARTTRTGC